MRDYEAEIGKLLDTAKPGQAPITSHDLEVFSLHRDLSERLADPSLDKASRLELEGMLQDTSKSLDIALEKATADQDSVGRRAGVFAQGIAKTIPSAWAGALDLGDKIVSKITGNPEGASATEWLNSKLPFRPINPDESKLETLGGITAGGLTNAVTGQAGSRIKDFVTGVASEVGGIAGGNIGQELTGGPYGRLIGALAGGALTNVAANAPSTAQRSLAKEAVGDLTQQDALDIRAAQAAARQDGMELTSGQTSSSPRYDGLRNLENYAAQRTGSRVRAMQLPQEDQALTRSREIVEGLPGQVSTREALARQGRDTAAAELNRITRQAQRAYQQALNANNGQLTPANIRNLDMQLQAIMRNPRRANIPGMAETVAELRRSLYNTAEIETRRIIPGRSEMDAITGEVDNITYPESVQVPMRVRRPIENIEELRGAQDRAQPSFKDSGIGNLNPTTRKQQAMVRATTSHAVSAAVPEIAQARDAMRRVFQQENFGPKKSANSLGGWVPKKGVTDEAAAPEAMLARLMDRGIEPTVPRNQSPPIRYAQQIGRNPQAADFFGSMVKTKLSETFTKAAKASDEAGEGFSSKVFSELANPAKARARRDMVEAWALTSGMPPEQGRQLSRGLDNFLQTLRAIERKAPASRKLPRFLPEKSGEAIALEGAAASQYTPRISSFISKYTWNVVANAGQRWIDTQLTTPGGIEFLIGYAKQNPGTDAAKGMVLGLLGEYAEQSNKQ